MASNIMFGAPMLMNTPLPATAAPATMPTAVPTTQMGLLGADPSRARADAFLRSLGAMAPGLLMAGAPSTDPGQRGKGLAMAFGAQPQAFQQDLARVRAENVQNINLEMARAKAAREAALFNQKVARQQRINQYLGISPLQTNLTTAAVQPALGAAAPATVAQTAAPAPTAVQSATFQNFPAVEAEILRKFLKRPNITAKMDMATINDIGEQIAATRSNEEKAAIDQEFYNSQRDLSPVLSAYRADPDNPKLTKELQAAFARNHAAVVRKFPHMAIKHKLLAQQERLKTQPKPLVSASPSLPPTVGTVVPPLPQNVLRAALLNENPGDIIAEHFMRVSDPKLKMLDGQLTGLGKLEQEDKLRGELKPVVTAFGNAQRFFNIVDGQLQKKNGTADIAGLNAMIKMIDAGMVTVGEVDLQREAQSTISRIQGAIAQFKGGRLLDSEKDKLRTNMRNTARDLLRDMHNAHKRSVMGYKGIADRRKLDWRNIWPMEGVFKDKPKTTGTGNNAVLKPRPNTNSINTQVPNLEPTEPG